MREFIRDFNKRVVEIDKYFDLVDRIEQLGAFSTNSITFPSGECIVDSDLQKILRSHGNVSFLTHLLQNIDDYIENRKYKSNP